MLASLSAIKTALLANEPVFFTDIDIAVSHEIKSILAIAAEYRLQLSSRLQVIAAKKGE